MGIRSSSFSEHRPELKIKSLGYEKLYDFTYFSHCDDTKLRSRLTNVECQYNVMYGSIVKLIQDENIHELTKIFTVNDIRSVQITDPETRCNVLHVAAKSENPALWGCLETLTQLHHLVNKSDKRGVTPIMVATTSSNLLATSKLLDLGADLYTRSDSKGTVLHHAIWSKRLLGFFLQRMTNKEFFNSLDGLGYSPTMLAVRAGLKDSYLMLLDAGVDPTWANPINGRTLLHVAALSQNIDLIADLVTRSPVDDFINKADDYDDTALMLALRIGSVEAVVTLLQGPCPARLSKTSEVSGESSLHLVVSENRPDLLEILLHTQNISMYLNDRSREGLTPLMLSVQEGHTVCFQLLFTMSPDITPVTYIKKRSALHLAALSGHCYMIYSLLNQPDSQSILHWPDHQNQSAFELAIVSSQEADVVFAFIETGHINWDYVNSKGETILYTAAKAANLTVFQAALLSPKFYNLYQSVNLPTSEDGYLDAELEHQIYVSDIYVLLGIEVGPRKWSKAPDQDHLFRKTENNQNIFHAAAQGLNTKCISFLFEYCTRFHPEVLEEIDQVDALGNSPLHLAAIQSNGLTSEFLLLKGANLAQKNKAGVTPLLTMIDKVANADKLLSKVLNSCVRINGMSCSYNLRCKNMQIDWGILNPDNEPFELKVVAEMFSIERLSHEVLKNPVVELYLELRWARLRQVVKHKLISDLSFAFLWSIYLTLKYSKVFAGSPIFLGFLKWVVILSSMYNAFMGLHLLVCPWNYRPMVVRAVMTLSILAPYFALVYFLWPENYRGAQQLASITALISWFSVLLSFGNIQTFSIQVAAYFTVLQNLFNNISAFCLVGTAFAFGFFVIFKDFYTYNNPVHSWLYTMTAMLLGNVDQNPVIDHEMMANIFNVSINTSGENFMGYKLNIDQRTELTNLLLPGAMVLLYTFLVQVCLLNLTIGIAVRHAEDIFEGSRVFQLRAIAFLLAEWEQFTQSRSYKLFQFFRLNYFLGFPANFQSKLHTPRIIFPHQYNVSEEQAASLQHLATVDEQPSAICLPLLRSSDHFESSLSFFPD